MFGLNILGIGQASFDLPFDAYLQFASWILDSLSGACLEVHTHRIASIFFSLFANWEDKILAEIKVKGL